MKLENRPHRVAVFFILCLGLLLPAGLVLGQTTSTDRIDVALDFKGIPLGSTDEVVRQKFSELRCNVPLQKAQTETNESIRKYWETKAIEADLVCQRAFADPEPPWPVREFAGHKAGSVGFSYFAFKLVRAEATLPVFAFSDIVDGLTAKYGSPSSKTTEQLQNRMGATFLNEIVSWRRGNATLEITKYGRDLETARYSLTADEYWSEVARRRATKAKGTAKSL